MQKSTIRYSKRTCFVYKESLLIGKIQFKREQHIGIWRVVYLSPDLPINSTDRPKDIQEKLCELELNWRWGKIYHCRSDIRY